MAQFAYNNRESRIIGVTLFYANNGRYLDMIIELLYKVLIALIAQILAAIIDSLYLRMKWDIKFITKKIAIYYDNRYIEVPDFKEGEKVFLLR